MRISRAIDAYDGDLARRGKSVETRRHYRADLFKLAAMFDTEATVDQITLSHYERFLDRWTDCAVSTLAGKVSLVRGFSHFLWKRGLTPEHVALPLERPRRKRPEDLKVKTVDVDEVARALDCCFDFQELLCIGALAYLGARRAAIARARRGDLNLRTGTIELLEKGGKIAVKRVPDEYLAILAAAEAHGVWAGPKDYLVPNRRPASVRRAERSDKVIWDTVKVVLARAGIDAHCHAFRAAFAVQYDEQHPGLNFELQDLMGHSRIETTLVYLRRKDKQRAMDTVADLSWGSRVFPEQDPSGSRTRVSAVRGQRPGPLDDGTVFEPYADDERKRLEPVPPESALPEHLRRKLESFSVRKPRRAKR